MTTQNFKFVTYNIDGLNEQNLEIRTLTALSLILSLSPDLIHLQEIVPNNAEEVVEFMKNNNYVSSHTINELKKMNIHYFTLTFVKKTIKLLNFRRNSFYTRPAQSNQGRDILETTIEIQNNTISFYNVHLESCGIALKSSESSIRMAQLSELFDRLLANHGVVAGDLNLRDKESDHLFLNEKFKSSIIDIAVQQKLEKLGTWFLPNSKSPKPVNYRFDRVYANKDSILEASKYELIGSEKLFSYQENSGYQTPSDHYGIYIEFNVNLPNCEKQEITEEPALKKKKLEIIDLTID